MVEARQIYVWFLVNSFGFLTLNKMIIFEMSMMGDVNLAL